MDMQYLETLPPAGQKLAKSIIANYGSIAAAARQLAIRRPLIYQWLNDGMSDNHAQNLKRRGINPKTLTRM